MLGGASRPGLAMAGTYTGQPDWRNAAVDGGGGQRRPALGDRTGGADPPGQEGAVDRRPGAGGENQREGGYGSPGADPPGHGGADGPGDRPARPRPGPHRLPGRRPERAALLAVLGGGRARGDLVALGARRLRRPPAAVDAPEMSGGSHQRTPRPVWGGASLLPAPRRRPEGVDLEGGAPEDPVERV